MNGEQIVWGGGPHAASDEACARLREARPETHLVVVRDAEVASRYCGEEEVSLILDLSYPEAIHAVRLLHHAAPHAVLIGWASDRDAPVLCQALVAGFDGVDGGEEVDWNRTLCQARARAAARLRRQDEGRYQLFFARHPDPAAMLDSNGHLLAANPAFVDATGHSADSFGERSVLDLVHYTSLDHHAAFAAVVRGDTDHHSDEVEVARVAGPRRRVRLSIFGAVRRGPVQPVRFAFLEELAENEVVDRPPSAGIDDFLAVFQHIGVGVAVAKVGARWARVNPELQRLLGLPGQVSGDALMQHTHPEDRLKDAGLFEDLVHGRRNSYGMEKRFIHAETGEVIWCVLGAAMSRDPSGAPHTVFATVTDVTELKQAEQELASVQTRLRYLLTASPAILYHVVLTGENSPRLTFVSDNIETILGVTPAEIGSEWGTWIERIHPEDAPRVLNGLSSAGDETMATVEYRFRHKDDSYRWIQAGVRIIREPGKQLEMVGYAIDVTERKEAEGALRTREAELRAAQKMEAVGQLTGGVAHDFNNVLMAIKGNTQLLLDQQAWPVDAQEDLLEIERAATRGQRLTQQLLAFSRRQVFRLEILDLRSVVSEICSMLRVVLGADVNVDCRFAGDLASVRADRSQMEQVIVNLMVNARDAMPEGGSLSIELSNVTIVDGESQPGLLVPPGEYVALALSDTGCGMDAATLARAYEPFFTTKELGRGTGLGLSTVYGIVKQSGGYIGIESEVGTGTTFRLYLPQVDERPVEPLEKGSTSSPVQGVGTILLVEDDAMIRKLVRRILSSAGYEVCEAPDGANALKVLASRQGEVDLLITDVRMPQMTGHELAIRIREIHPYIPVIFMSGYSEGQAQWSEQAAAGESFLQKPVEAETLLLAVRRAVSQGMAHPSEVGPAHR